MDSCESGVERDHVAGTPAASGSASTLVVDGNTADIMFTVGSVDTPVSLSASVTKGALKNVSHIDILYNADVPFRIRLLTSGTPLPMTVLLAGASSDDRKARIRVKDFTPGPEAAKADIDAASLVSSDYMSNVTGLQFESAAIATGTSTCTSSRSRCTGSPQAISARRSARGRFPAARKSRR